MENIEKMNTAKETKCDSCMNGWVRISENGYCVKCGKPCEVKCSYSCMFGEVDARIKARTPKERGGEK